MKSNGVSKKSSLSILFTFVSSCSIVVLFPFLVPPSILLLNKYVSHSIKEQSKASLRE
jgi:hypothetical protein